MTAPECLAALTEISSALWAARELRIRENGDDCLARGLFNCAQKVGDAASMLSSMQAEMAGHYALSDMLTGAPT